MVALAKMPVVMSVQEFLAWNSGDGLSWQLVDGVPQAMAPASLTHAALQGELGALIRNHLRETGSRCKLFMNPGVVPPVMSSHNMRIPDLAVTCSPVSMHKAELPDPVLIVEFLSPSNQAETWANVWAYTTIPSVVEIVVVRTVTIGGDVLRRGADGSWAEEPERVVSGELVLESIGMRTSLVALYEGTPLAEAGL